MYHPHGHYIVVYHIHAVPVPSARRRRHTSHPPPRRPIGRLPGRVLAAWPPACTGAAGLMPDAVCQMLTLLCTLVVACPIGTNLGLLHLLWVRASGRLLAVRRGRLLPRPLADGRWSNSLWRRSRCSGPPASSYTPPRHGYPRAGVACLNSPSSPGPCCPLPPPHRTRDPRRLLRPPAAAHPWPAPAVPGAHALSAGLPRARTPRQKSVRDGPSPQGILGAAAYPCHTRHTHDPCQSNRSYRKPEN